jgi:hypothetical protein
VAGVVEFDALHAPALRGQCGLVPLDGLDSSLLIHTDNVLPFLRREGWGLLIGLADLADTHLKRLRILLLILGV